MSINSNIRKGKMSGKAAKSGEMVHMAFESTTPGPVTFTHEAEHGKAMMHKAKSKADVRRNKR